MLSSRVVVTCLLHTGRTACTSRVWASSHRWISPSFQPNAEACPSSIDCNSKQSNPWRDGDASIVESDQPHAWCGWSGCLLLSISKTMCQTSPLTQQKNPPNTKCLVYTLFVIRCLNTTSTLGRGIGEKFLHELLDKKSYVFSFHVVWRFVYFLLGHRSTTGGGNLYQRQLMFSFPRFIWQIKLIWLIKGGKGEHARFYWAINWGSWVNKTEK